MSKRLSGGSFVSVTLAVVALAASMSAQGTHSPVITLVVDESQAVRQIAFVHEEVQVHPGAMALAYPLWIPGEHGPTGPIQDFAKLRIRAGDAALRWTRDPEEVATIHVNIPPGTNTISIDFSSLSENTITDHQLLLAWNTVVLYPLGIDKTKLMVQPSLLLPMDWKNASSLTVTSQSGNRTDFAPTSLERLIDSPVLAGEFLRTVPLHSTWPAELDITGDSQAAVDNADGAHAFDLFSKLIDQSQMVFGFRHWQKLHILVSQSDSRNFDGLEHEDSPYSGVGDAALSSKGQLEKFGWVDLAHEVSHSWIGKYRRPAELYSKPDYQGPEHASLLWVYEGLNQYEGMLLATRAGFNDAAYMREYLGRSAADVALESGRTATPLVDTGTENWVFHAAGNGWSDVRRRQDYYYEGAVVWLHVDTIIREQTQGRKSLDEFLHTFFGQRDTGPIVVPYTREDVEAALGAICPYDWHAFFESRVYQVNSKPPEESLEASGWRLVYNDTPNSEFFYSDLVPINVWADHSVGLKVQKDGSISDVVSGSPAYDAGFGPHMTILAVDGHIYSADALNDAIAHPRNGKITLIVRNFDSVETREIHYAGGLHYPHLERIPGTRDYLSEILAPRSKEQ
jgi:predicted metalloprotease with PDZ domain